MKFGKTRNDWRTGRVSDWRTARNSTSSRLRSWLARYALLSVVMSWPLGFSSLAKAEPPRHWAFQPIVAPAIPEVKNKKWVRNPIDAFVLSKLEAKGLAPAAPADRATFFRRMNFDLLGLPPALEELEAYFNLPDVATNNPKADIDKLLESPHYGERWARHWLDVVRYADSAGYEIDGPYAHASLYRDYVIRAFNADTPFDRFIQEQIAGDELFPDSAEAKLGTSFATVGPYAFEGGIARPKVVEHQRLTDLVDTTGAAFLGLTIGCARCHNHKYDPISQKDYYALQAIFAASEPKLLNTEDGAAKILANRDKPAAVHLLRRGELDSPGNEIAPAIFVSLPGGRRLDIAANDESKSRRSALAKWITAPENPLTARVLANRVWQWHFGKGLVRTPNDFGMQGEPPTHPELLDYLAMQLLTNKWSLNRLHQLIMTSNTYRMSSSTTPAIAAQDPDHLLLTRFPRRRLEAEALWDHLHATSGTLNRQMYGPAITPPIDAKALNTLINKNWKVTDDAKQFTRRGIYLVVRRSITLPFFETFNVSLPVESQGRRDNTIVGAQALTLLNGPVAVEQARHMAGRLLRESNGDADKLVSQAWLLAFSRPIKDNERKLAIEFLHTSEKAFESADAGKMPKPLGDFDAAKVSRARAAAVVTWCLALINANEFAYID